MVRGGDQLSSLLEQLLFEQERWISLPIARSGWEDIEHPSFETLHRVEFNRHNPGRFLSGCVPGFRNPFATASLDETAPFDYD